ncbi:MAG TPA: M28 family peptidase [Burkholderiales bacterium]|nr:M28 family peptidase [Burkholderiales bacterium]
MTLLRGRLVLVVAAALALFVGFAVWFMTAMPGTRHHGSLLPLGVEDQQLLANLKAHVLAVASEEHNVGHPEALERSARYIESTLSGLGYAVSRQEFETEGVKVRNLEVRRAGPGTGKPRIIVIGAHYDSALGAVGADDNGSGVAALLELARLLKSVQPAEGLEMRLIFYVNEELPWFATEKMGSLVHASGLAREDRQVVAMLSLETIGWYSDEPGSQRYPFPFNLLYPSTGDFIGFVANPPSRRLLHRVIASFRRHTAFPSEGGVGLESIAGVSWSDQWAYWKFGWPAVMVTDTAPFRYPHYHTLRDTPDKLDYDRFARVVRGLEGVVRDLVIATPSN